MFGWFRQKEIDEKLEEQKEKEGTIEALEQTLAQLKDQHATALLEQSDELNALKETLKDLKQKEEQSSTLKESQKS